MQEEPFTNQQIDVAHIPSIHELVLMPLHKDYLTAKILGSVIFWLIVSGVLLSIVLIKNDEFPGYLKYAAIGVLAILIVTRFIFVIAGYRMKKYALREHDILYKSGLLWRSNTVIPFNRIQHAEVNQGPIERLFNLSMLRIFTAGGSSSDMAIPGLRPQEAHRIKGYILKKTSMDEEE